MTGAGQHAEAGHATLGGSRHAQLVPIARQLGETLGGWPQAATAVLRVPVDGLDAVGTVSSDVRLLLADQGRAVGLVDDTGAPSPVVAAELLVVIDVLAAAAVPTSHPPAPEPPALVCTLPRTVAGLGLVEPHERLHIIMLDTITRATETLVIGGPYWNDESVDELSPPLAAAVASRGVDVSVYAHRQTQPGGHDFDAPVRRLVHVVDTAARQTGAGSVRLRWFAGPASSLMHAKFLVGDRRYGYLGSANLTSQGMGSHFELGVQLLPSQASQLVSLLDALDAANMFTAPEATGTLPSVDRTGHR